jgi:hypothetical protein
MPPMDASSIAVRVWWFVVGNVYILWPQWGLARECTAPGRVFGGNDYK